MAKQPKHEGSKARVARHRVRAVAEGFRRVEITVPANDTGLVKAVAGVLRAGGDDAKRVRDAFASMIGMEPVRTGRDLVAFLRASPLVGEDLAIKRDKTTGRPVELESWHT